MWEQFNIEGNAFQKQDNWPIAIDGHLSDEEKQELKESFECDCGVIRDETQWSLQDFLKQDVIPNLSQSGLSSTQQDSLHSLAEWNTTEVSDTNDINTDLLSEYWLNEEQITALTNKLWEFGIEQGINTLLGNYESYMQTNLSWFNASILAKIKQSIGMRILNLDGSLDKTDDRITDLNEQDVKSNYRWVVNGHIQDHLSEINDKILPSAVLLHKYNLAEDKNEFTEQALEGVHISSWRSKLSKTWFMERKVWEIQDMFAADLDDDGQFDELWAEFFNQAGTLDIARDPRSKRIFQNIGQSESDLNNMNILNESDVEIERNAMKVFMGMIGAHIALEAWPAVLASVVPGIGTAAGALVWNLAGAWIDIKDTFSDREELLVLAQKAWMVPKEYRMNKTLLDNVLAWLWLIPWVTIATKTAKLARIMVKYGFTDGDFSKSLEQAQSIMKMKKKDFQKSESAASDEVLRANGKLNDKQRFEKAAELLGKELTQQQKNALMVAHAMPQWNNTAKWKHLMQNGFNREQARILMDNGLAGFAEFWKKIHDQVNIPSGVKFSQENLWIYPWMNDTVSFVHEWEVLRWTFGLSGGVRVIFFEKWWVMQAPKELKLSEQWKTWWKIIDESWPIWSEDFLKLKKDFPRDSEVVYRTNEWNVVICKVQGISVQEGWIVTLKWQDGTTYDVKWQNIKYIRSVGRSEQWKTWWKYSEATTQKKTDIPTSVNEMVSGGLHRPTIVDGKYGKIVWMNDVGKYDWVNEDNLIIVSDKGAFASIDGMWSYWNWKQASDIFAQEYWVWVTQGKTIEEIHKKAHLRMKSEWIWEGWVAFVSWKINNDYIDIHHVGDARVMILSKDGTIKFVTQDHKDDLNNLSLLTNAVQWINPGKLEYNRIPLDDGDRIIAASDGLWDNIKQGEVESLAQWKTPEQLMSALSDLAIQRMQGWRKIDPNTGIPYGKSDNINIYIQDYKSDTVKSKTNKAESSKESPEVWDSIEAIVNGKPIVWTFAKLADGSFILMETILNSGTQRIHDLSPDEYGKTWLKSEDSKASQQQQQQRAHQDNSRSKYRWNNQNRNQERHSNQERQSHNSSKRESPIDKNQGAYKVLWITSDTLFKDAQKTYRRLMMKYHPDRNRSDPSSAAEMTKKINVAWSAIKDKLKKN